MATRKKTSEDVKEELRRARADLRDDIAALDHQLHVDIPARLKKKVPLAAGVAGAAAVTAAAIAIVKRRRKKNAARKPPKRRR